MKELQKRFIDTFSVETQQHISEFIKAIWEKDSDFFIFMARKAACFFDCLRELQLAGVHGIALNDRVLDLDLTFLKGKKVTLVDDCIFSGTTIHSAYQKVLRAGCKSVDTMTLAINKDWLCEDLLPGRKDDDKLNLVTPILQLSDSQCVEQCFSIVQGISIIPRQYDVDFPCSKTYKIKDSLFRNILNFSQWHCYDVTSTYQANNNCRSYSLIPENKFLQDFLNLHSGDQRICSFAKIRVYARKLGGDSWSVRFVPMVMIKGIKDTHLVQKKCLWNEEIENVAKIIGCCNPVARYRLFNFLLSWSFFSFWKKVFGNCFSNAIRTDLADMTFGNFFSKSFENLDIDKIIFTLPSPEPHRLSNYLQECIKKKTNIVYERDIDDVCTKPFLDLYRTQEIPTRKQIQQNGLDGKNDFSRLKHGFTCDDILNETLNGTLDLPEDKIKNLISISIDRNVDLGIAVPIITSECGCQYRAFRHGEDAIYGEVEERILLIALEAFLVHQKDKFFRETEFNKLVALLVQIGIRDSYFLRYNKKNAIDIQQEILSIKGHLHGLVPFCESVFDESGQQPYAINTSWDNWLLKRLTRRGYLVQNKDNIGYIYTIGHIPEQRFEDRREIELKKRARTLGKLVKSHTSDDNKPINRTKDLILLSSCSEPDFLIRALCGEWILFIKRWPDIRENVKNLVEKKEYDRAFNTLKSEGDLFTALNSGVMKYKWFVDREFSQKIKQVEEYSLKIDETKELADDWKILWPQRLIESIDSVDNSRAYIINKLGRWLISQKMAYALYLYWMILKNEINGYNMSKYRENYKKICIKSAEDFLKYNSSHTNSDFGQIASQIANGKLKNTHIDTISQYCRQSKEFLETGIDNIQDFIDQIQLLSDNYGNWSEIQTYPHVLTCSIFNPDRNRLYSKQELIEIVVKTGSLQIPYEITEDTISFYIKGNRNSSEAYVLAKKIIEFCGSKNVFPRIIVFSQLANNEAPKSLPGAKGYSCRKFHDKKRAFESIIQKVNAYKNNRYRCLLSVNEITEGAIEEIEKIKKILGDKIFSLKKFEENVSSQKYCIVQGDINMAASQCDIGIITILPEEAYAVLSLAEQKEHISINKHEYHKFSLPVENNWIQIVHRRTLCQGNVSSATTFMEMLQNFSPKLIVVMGIAGGISPKVSCGDVVVAQKVIYYDLRKIEKERNVRKPILGGEANAVVTELFNAFQVEKGQEIIKITDSDNKIFWGSIGCGEAVIKNISCDERNWLHEVGDDILAVEMESFGAWHGAWENNICNCVVTMSIRGISDKADQEKNDNFRNIACKNAALAFKELLPYINRFILQKEI